MKEIASLSRSGEKLKGADIVFPLFLFKLNQFFSVEILYQTCCSLNVLL